MMLALVDLPVCDQDYLDDLWFLLHQADDGELLVLGLTSFLDDSGSDEQSPITAIGGPIMSRIKFKALASEWRPLLQKYRVPEPLHMTDFVRPNGKHIGMPIEMKLSLFRDLAALINRHKLYSLSVSIPQVDFHQTLPPDVCKSLIGPYALAFFCAVLLNRGVGRQTGRQVRVAYLVDDGVAYKEQLVAAHSVVLHLEKGEFRHTAALGFDVDDNVPALQAADVISWGALRRTIAGAALTGEYEPLNTLFSTEKPPHGHTHIPRDGIEIWSTPIRNWIASTGKIPSFEEFIEV